MVQSGIMLNDNFSNALYRIIDCVSFAVTQMDVMAQAMNAGIDTSSLDGARDEINQATMAANELSAALERMNAPESSIDVPTPPPPEPVEVPIQWQSPNLDVFTNSGVERFQQEVQSANIMLEQLINTQAIIAAQAQSTTILPPQAVSDINGMTSRIDGIRDRIQQIESNPLNMGTDATNSALEQLRAQLSQAVDQQQNLNDAMNNLDVETANDAYLRLSQIIANTERYIRDNVDEQGEFNNRIRDGTERAFSLESAIGKVVGAVGGLAIIGKIFSFAKDCMSEFDEQLNSEVQLLTVLSNTLDATSVTIDVNADTTPLEAAFDQISNKVDEISGKGIYGGEMMAGAGELSSYMSDINAVTSMMDTLSNYAMGMSGGGEVNSQQMVEYATQLGKAFNGAYDGLTKKGFELTEAQKAIIDTGTDMEKALVLDEVISESWDNLYVTMSDTPQGQIIQLKNAWGDIGETIGKNVYPYVMQFVDIITSNWGTIESLMFGLSTVIGFIGGVLSVITDAALSFVGVIVDNWSWIAPLILGIAAAFAVYTAVTKGAAFFTGIAGLAVKAWTAIQTAFNAVMALNPVAIVVIAIILLIAVIAAVCSAIAKFTGVASSGFGVFCGAINVGIQFLKNLGIIAANIGLGIICAMTAVNQNIKTAFHNAICSVQSWWYNLLSTVLTVVAGICEALNKIPFVEFDYSGVSNAAQEYANKSAEAAGNKQEYTDVGAAFDKGFNTFDAFGDGWAKDAFDAGASWGDGISDKISNFSVDDLFGVDDIPGAEDLADNLGAGLGDAFNTSGAADNLDSIAGSTGSIADSLSITEENLKYLRDLAEQETVNKFTTAEVKIDAPITNNVSSNVDMDGFVSGLTDAMQEATNILTEGVHK